MFHLNYQKHIKKFNTRAVFSKGKFHKVTPYILKNILEKLKLVLQNDGIVIFSNKMSNNDKIICKNLFDNKYHFKYYNDLIVISKNN